MHFRSGPFDSTTIFIIITIIWLAYVPVDISCDLTSGPSPCIPQQVNSLSKSNPIIILSDLRIIRELFHFFIAYSGQVIILTPAVGLCIWPLHTVIHIVVFSFEAGVQSKETEKQKNGDCSLQCHIAKVSSVLTSTGMPKVWTTGSDFLLVDQ